MSEDPGAGPADAVDPTTGLRPRPQMPPDVLAAVAAAVHQLTAVAPPTARAQDATYLAWRFSGRWWHRPLPTRRARPYPSHGG